MANRVRTYAGWIPARLVDPHHVAPMEVQVWDYIECCYSNRPEAIEKAIRRAIDLADAMQCVICIDVEQGSVVVNPNSEYEEILEIYFDLRKR